MEIKSRRPIVKSSARSTRRYLEDTLPALAKDAVGRPLPKLLYWLLDARGKIDSLYDKGKDAEPVQALLAVGKTLMHGCPLILWEDVTSCVEINP